MKVLFSQTEVLKFQTGSLYYVKGVGNRKIMKAEALFRYKFSKLVNGVCVPEYVAMKTADSAKMTKVQLGVEDYSLS